MAFMHESGQVFSASESFVENANVQDGMIYQNAQADRLGFWAEQAKQLHWITPWHTVLDWQRPNAKWFLGGQLNASANCLDVHINTHRRHKAALIWEGEQGDIRTVTYFQLYQEVSRLADALRHQFGIQKGDCVTIYMPMICEAVVAILACARVGAIHSVVFGGFSAQSLKDRIIDSDSKLIITADGGFRRGHVVPLKPTVDKALEDPATRCAEAVIVVRHLGDKAEADMQPDRDVWYHDVLARAGSVAEPEVMDSEDELFILYTSGTTGKPKGIVHTTGGYMTHAKYSSYIVFDLKDSDIYWCTADVGWITGHTYVVYGPLANGATVFLYEGAPDYPNFGRFWDMIERHRISILYTAPTAIRAFMKVDIQLVKKHDLTSLRLLGTVGEPINPEAWLWYHEHIGGGRCPIVDTWWQTETGGIIISNLPALNVMKPGYAGLALPGIEIKILGEDGKPKTDGQGFLSITEPWPSMLRGVWKNPERYKETYWSKYDGYFAGDGAYYDDDGYILVVGRVDDVLKLAGHRIGTMEVESALVDYPDVAEAAVVGVPDEIKGEAIMAFVILKEHAVASEDLRKTLIQFVADQIGAIARPKDVIFAPDLPKTRSGKIMRRLLRDIAMGKPSGDTTTLANPAVVEELTAQMAQAVR